MQEYTVDLAAALDGSFTLDIHQPGSSGTSSYQRFETWDKLEDFFRSLGLGEDLFAELQEVRSQLKEGTAYHQQMFLPISMDGQVTFNRTSH